MYQTIISGVRPKMQDVLLVYQEKVQTIRAGRASTEIIENIVVEYYGTQTPLKQMASLTVPQSNTIMITPWDQNAINDIDLSIKNSGLGFNPVNDGRNLRIVLPPLTEERREEFIKMVGKMSEEAKIAIRLIRQDAWDKIKTLEKEKKLTEDDRYRAEKELNDIIEDFTKKILDYAEKKGEDLRKI